MTRSSLLRIGFQICLLSLRLLLLPMNASAQDTVIDAHGDRVNLRAAPTLEASVLSLLPSGTPLTALRLSADSQWLYVSTEDLQTGWVFRALTRFTSGDESDLMLGRVRLAPEVASNVESIFRRGQALNLNDRAFAKVGDSISVSDHWLKPIAAGDFHTADYRYLNDVIAHFGSDSFARASAAAGIGWSSFIILDPDSADPDQCLSGESPLICEYRIMQPAVALIMLGSNDVGILQPSDYRYNMRRILDLTLARGIIPVLSTIPQRVGFEDRVDVFNRIVRDLAAEYRLPLVDYFAAMVLLPGLGLDEDGVHPNVAPHGLKGEVDFHAENLNYGYVIRNLTTLQILDAVYRVIREP